MRSLLLIALAACATGKSTSGGEGGAATFKVFYPDQPPGGFKAKVGKRFSVKPVATCTYENGRDARWKMTGARITTGELPEGVRIEDGTISGTPKAAGTWTVEVTFSGVSCAGSPETDVVIPVTINAR